MRTTGPMVDETRVAVSPSNVRGPISIVSAADLANPMYTVREVMRSSWHRTEAGRVAGSRTVHTPHDEPGVKTTGPATTRAVSIRADAPLTDAIRIMGQHGVTALPVVDRRGHTIGVLVLADALPYITRRGLRHVLGRAAARAQGSAVVRPRSP